jgi:hypothetical protein
MSFHWRSRRIPRIGQRFWYGLQIALVLSIPLWAIAGLGLAWALQAAPASGIIVALLILVVGLELLLLRHMLQLFGTREGSSGQGRDGAAGVIAHYWTPAAKRTVALGTLSAAYLQYYYWDVMLQIESMHSVVVFVPSSRFI